MQTGVPSSAESRPADVVQGLVLVLPCTTAVMGSAVLAPNIPQLILEFHDLPGVEFWVTALITLPALCLALFSVIAGAITDRFGRRRVMLQAMVVYGFVGMLPLVVQEFWLIFASRAVLGIMEAIILCSSTVLIGDYFQGTRRDHWLAMQTFTASASSIVMFPLGGYVGQFGWQYPFAMYGFSLLLVVPMLLFTWEPVESRELDQTRFSWPWLGAVLVATTFAIWSISRLAGWLTPVLVYALTLLAMLGAGVFLSSRRPEPARGAGDWATFPWIRTSGIYLVTAIAAMLFFVMQITLARVLAETGVTDPFRTGLIIAAVSLGVPAGTLVFSRMLRTPISYLLLLQFVILAVGFWGMAAAPDLRLLMLAAFVNQIGAGMTLPTMLTWAMRQFPFAQRGRGVGLSQAFFNGGQFVGPTFVTWLAVQFTLGAIKPAYQYVAWGAAVMAAGALIAILVGKGIRFPGTAFRGPAGPESRIPGRGAG